MKNKMNLTIITTHRGDFYKAFFNHDKRQEVARDFVYHILGIHNNELNGFCLEHYIHAYLGSEFSIEAWELDIS